MTFKNDISWPKADETLLEARGPATHAAHALLLSHLTSFLSPKKGRSELFSWQLCSTLFFCLIEMMLCLMYYFCAPVWQPSQPTATGSPLCFFFLGPAALRGFISRLHIFKFCREAVEARPLHFISHLEKKKSHCNLWKKMGIHSGL